LCPLVSFTPVLIGVRGLFVGAVLVGQPQHILHIVKPGRLVFGPQRCAHCTGGKQSSTLRPVGEFETFAITSKYHCVVARYAPAAQ